MSADYDRDDMPMKKSGMMSEKDHEFSNMPQAVKHVAYPKASFSCNGEYRDNIEGLDEFSKENYKQLEKQIRRPSSK